MFSSGIKRGMRVLFLLVIFTILASSVHAFGVSTPYLENDTLRVLPGQNYTYSLTLQNGDIEGYYVDIVYSSTNNIVSMDNQEYYVPAKTYNNTFNFKINIPQTAQVGEIYVLEYSARPRANSSGTVTLGVEIKRNIKILVTDASNTNVKPLVVSIEKSKSIDYNKIFQMVLGAWKYILPAVLLVLILIVIIIVWKVSKKASVKISLSGRRKTNHTISQATSLAEVRTLLEKISDEQYDLPEIREIFKNKLSELTNNDVVDEISRISREDAIIALNHILK